MTNRKKAKKEGKFNQITVAALMHDLLHNGLDLDFIKGNEGQFKNFWQFLQFRSTRNNSFCLNSPSPIKHIEMNYKKSCPLHIQVEKNAVEKEKQEKEKVI